MRLPFLEPREDGKQTDGSASFLRAARAGNLEKVLEFLKTNTDINTCNANGLNALHLASKEGHVNVVRELLQRGANVDAATKKGNTALHIASLAGQEEIVKVLVQHQALVNIQSQNGFTPLYMAAQENHDSVVRFLLANNANQSLATEDGFTPLAVALQQGHDKVVAVLLENDTRGKVRLPALHIAAKKDDTKAAALLLHTDHNPDVTSKSGFTPLHIASHYGNENIANLLIQRGADVNYIAKHQITPLHVASKWGKGNMVSLLIDKGANYEAKTRDGLTPLHCAARSGHEAVVDMLLEKGAPITSKTKNGLAPLHMSSQGDHVDAARILLYHKAPVDDVTVDFLTALHVAAHCGHVRVAKLLLDRKAEANARALNGFTPLHIACKKNRIKVVELLLKHGASIEATTESGLTPLHVASFMGCMNIVIYLLQHSATADVPTVRGETPLHLAARANQTDIIRILLRNGAQVDARAREQQTALHIASRLGNSDIVVLLLQHGAAVDATTKDHYTALHIAAKEGQEEVASVLLEHGASLTSTTKKGFTPLHLAAKYGNMKVARLLLQKDAPVDAQGKNGVTPLHVAAHYDHQNVALLLLDKGASPHATAKNGYTPLHIAARKNQMDIATTLLEYGASANAESKAGFTPLHLSSQEGHTDMATLLIEHNAAPGACAKNGLTPLHLCGQEDRVNVAAILVKHGAEIDPVTKAGYTPLHVACHFGQMNMVRFLLQHGAKVNSTTQLGYTPLHQAAQQGHTQIVNLLLENKAEPNTETNDGKTALSIAQRLGYISVVETLKIVTETTINTTTTTTTEEKYKVVVPETMHETFMSESEDEGGDDTMLGDQSYRYLTVDEMKSLGDDSLPIDVTKDEKMDMSFSSNQMAAPPVAPADHLSPQHQKEHYAQMTASYPADNVDVGKAPILAGPESLNTTLNTTIDSAMIEALIEPQIIQTKLAQQQMSEQQIQVENNTDVANSGSVSEKATEILNGWEGFLVSFMVDARGGAMRGCRHSGVRVIIPPRKAAMPMRVTCRYLKKDKLVHAPPLMEGEALASRILEMGPAGAKFLGPVIIEVPHFASLRGKEREIVILRSDNGETWREHTLEATEEAVLEVLNESFDGEELKQLEDLNTNRITRILTTDFPQYFAIVTRIRQEVHAIGPEGGMVSSTVVPQVQAVFPQGALTKKIKVGLQAQPIPTDLVAKLLGNRVAVSPIVTVEPRRRKFHKPITLTIPVPQASSKGMINQYSGEAPTLRLLCSITGGTTRAQWEDVTGSTPLTFVNDCVSFTTTVSARFWLMDCSNIPEATKMATELYREAIHVPFMAKFVVFSKRHQLEEARMRVFCMTDDREDKTLEHQELFVEVAKSRDVEVLEGKPQFLEFAGNLVPVTKSGDQLAFNFYAFRENRLPFTVRVKDQHADPIGRVAFMRQPKVGRGDPPQTPICNLNIALPDNIQPEPAPSEPDLLALEKKYSFLSISKADTIHRANLRLTDISNMLGTDWVALAHELEVTDSDINIIKSQYPDNAPQQAIVMLRLWMQTAGNKASGNTVGKALRKINREDIVKQCIFNVEVVTDDIEKAMAKAHLDQSGFETFKDELGPSRDATLNRDVSLDVSYDEQDMMKEAESAEEEEENQRAYHDKSSREQHTADLSPTYESEEKKYAGEEKVVTDEKVTKEEAADDSTPFTSFTATSTPIKKDTKEEDKLEADKKHKASKPTQIVPDTVQENKEETISSDQVIKEPVEESVTKESISKEEPKSVEKEIDTSIKEKVKPDETKKVNETPEASQKESEKVVTSTTKTEVVGRPGDATSVTTETKSYTTADDGTVQEHIVVKKQTTKVVDGKEMEEDKSAILQKLGEELGKLDEQLEEKFKKRKAEKPEVVQEEVKEEAVVAQRRESQTQPTSQVVVEHGSEPPTLPATTTTTTTSITPIPDGFTQASVESSQMSSTRGPADVSFPGADTAVMQLDGALTQQTVPWIEDGRISHEDPPRQSSYHKKGHSQALSTILPADQVHISRTEERGCSPITVLEARNNPEEIAEKPYAKGSSHTITTTTSWGAPLSATTNIQIEDDNSPHCLQFTLHSESRVTLHASKDVIQDLQQVNQHQEQKQPQELLQASQEEKCHEGTSHSLISEEMCERIQESEARLDKPLGEKTSEAVLIETSDSKHIESRQKDCSDVEMVCQAEIARVEDASEVDSSLVVSLSNDKTVPKGIGTEEAKGVAPEILDSEVPAALSDDHDFAVSEVTASSAHRPTTLMITSNSNESSDDAECTTNDHTRFGGENDISQDLKQGGDMVDEEESKQEESDKKQSTAASERLSGSESGAVPRLERSARSSPRTTTLVKVKVEKRPVGSHSQVRDRSSHDHLTVVRTHSVEEEVRGLMQEVKEATSQIKQEVKELRQADTPTPDTPTPLREFKEFLNREEEQEQERLPTIKEICRESEEDSSTGMGGEHMRDEYFHLRLNSPVHEPSLPEQIAPSGFDDKSYPDSGYSTMEGYYAKSVDPAQTAKYSPSCCEMVPEGSFDEHSVQSELESPSSPVDIKALSPVVCSVGSAVPTASGKQNKSKFKSFLKKVCKLTSKGGAKYETRNNDGQGELTLNRDSSEQTLKTKHCTLQDGKTSGMVEEKKEIQSQQLNTDDLMQAESVKFVLNTYLEEERSNSDEGNIILPLSEESVQYFDENYEKSVKDNDLSESYSPVTLDRSEFPVTDPAVSAVHYICTTSIKEIHLTDIQMHDTPESEMLCSKSSLPIPEDEQDECGQMKETQDVSFVKVSGADKVETSDEDAGFISYYENLENWPPSNNFQLYDQNVQLLRPDEEIVKQPMEMQDQYHKNTALLPVQTLPSSVDWQLSNSETKQQRASFSAEEYIDDAKESDLQEMDYSNEFESVALGVTVPDCVTDSMAIYDHTSPILEEMEEETTSFNQQISVMSDSPPVTRKGSHIPKLSEVNKFTLSEEEFDDYIDLPDTDIVEIMETVIEVDETEESDEMHHEEEKIAPEVYIPSQEEKYSKIGVETWKAKRKKKEHQTNLYVQEEEIQLLSEVDIETINESLAASNEFTSYEHPLQLENKIVSDITLLSEDQEKKDGITLHDSNVAGEACLLDSEACQREIDETRRMEQCTEETIKRAREITEHILKEIENMDVGNKNLTDIVSEGDTDFDFILESEYKSPTSKEIDSEMEMSFSDDFPVTVPELNETDNWLQTIKAYQSRTFKASDTFGDTPSVLRSKKEKQANQNFNETDCDWLLFMKKVRSISHNETKESETQIVAESEKLGDDDIKGMTDTVGEDVRRDATEMVTCESEHEPNSADYHDNNTQHSQRVEDITQSPYKVCLYTSDGESLHLKGILEDEKLPGIHDETTSDIIERKTDSSFYESSLCESSDNLKNTSEYIDQNEFTLGNVGESISECGTIMESEVISIKQASDFVCEINIPEDHLLAATETCQEVGKASVTVYESDLCSNEQKYLSQCVVDVKDPTVERAPKSEAVVDNRMEVLTNEDDEKSAMMSSVSEELKAIISTIECTLVAGKGRHLEIGPLMKRLDEMEKEIIDSKIDFEVSESSIPDLVDYLNVHCVVSTSQTSTPTEEVKMPVGLEKEAVTLNVPGCPSPSGEMNGQDIQEALTDIEELHSEGDISPMPKRKTLLSAPKQDPGALTDTEDMDLSGDEDLIPEENKNLPTIEALGMLPEPVREVINLTEGYAREPSPLHGSDSESEKEDVLDKHRKNIKRVDTLHELSVPTEDIIEGLTDVEDMMDSGEEDVPAEVDDSLPDYYMAEGEDVSNKEDLRVMLPAPKIFVTRKEDSTDDEEDASKKHKNKSRSLRVDAVQEGTTDVEDLDVSDKDVRRESLPKSEAVVRDKVRRKKQVRRKALPQKPASKILTTPSEDTACLTDVEVLTGDENVEEGNSNLSIHEDELDDPTDSEDIEASDAEIVDDLVPKPVEKKEPLHIPEAHRERIRISDVEERAEEESGDETDEEGFELNDKEDKRPLVPRKRVVYEPLDNEEKDALDVNETEDPSLTDTEDFDIEEKEEKEVMDEIINRIPKESAIYTITEMEGSMGKVTKKEMVRDADAEIKRKIKEAEQAGITIQAAMEEECLTDVEDLDATEESKRSKKKVTIVKNKKRNDETDEESVNESDIEEEVAKPQKNKRKSKRLPIVPQLSEVRFVETDTGPLSIIITPDSKLDTETVEKVTGVAFIESENDDGPTDVEELSDGEGNNALSTPSNKAEPVTDTEDLEFDPSEVNRPRSPLPPHIKYNVLQSPKRELVYIKEDKHGVPQVTVRKLQKDELLVSDIDDAGATDTEDIEVSEEEALRLTGATTDSTSDFEFSDCGNTEIASKLGSRLPAGKPDEEEEGNTDVEELILSKKPRHKAKARSKLVPAAHGEDSHTDTEFLSDLEDKGKLVIRTPSPNDHTDVEDFDHSDNDIEEPDREDAPTPDIIRDAAIKKTVKLTEGPHGTTYTEDATVASSKLLNVEAEPEGTTDVEDMEMSGAEDDGQAEHPDVNLPEYEASSVDISVRSSLPSTRNEEKQVKDNLLLPEDNFNNITDVESLGEGEGNRCASNTSLLSGQQLTCAVESCFVDELSYPSPATDPKLCIHPGLSIESDPFCAELTTPIVVEAELEQVYYHTPQDRPQQTEMELEAHNGCIVRRRQVVASTYQAREIRRFWSSDRNSPLHQSEIGDFASPTTGRKEFKTILYLEQPNLLDTISISDTLCDPEYFKKERLHDFDSSSIDSFEDQLSYKDSDAITVIDQLDLDRSCSFDDLPSPHLSNFSSSIIGSTCSGESFCSNPQFFRSFCSTPLLDMTADPDISLQSGDKSVSIGFLGNDVVPIQTSSLNEISIYDKHGTFCSDEERSQKKHDTFESDLQPQESVKYEASTNPFLDFSDQVFSQIPQILQTKEWDAKSNATNPSHAIHFNQNNDPSLTLIPCYSDSPLNPFRTPSHSLNAGNTLPFFHHSQDLDGHISVEIEDRSDSSPHFTSVVNPDNCAKSEEGTQHLLSNYDDTSLGNSTKWLKELYRSHSKDLSCEERPSMISCNKKSNDYKSHKILLANQSSESILEMLGGLDLGYPNVSPAQSKEEIELFGDKSVQNLQNIEAHAHLNVSIDDGREQKTASCAKELVVTDCVSGHEETGSSSVNDIYLYHDDFSPTYDYGNSLMSTIPTCTQKVRQVTQGNTHSQNIRHNSTVVVPLKWRHTLPMMCKQLKNRAKSESIINDISDQIHQVKSSVGVRDLIDQWEEIVEEEKRRSLPASPAGGRRVMPPFEEQKLPELPPRAVCESGIRKSNKHEDQAETERKMEDSKGGNVVEQVASVCDIIQQFEGKFAQCEKQNVLRPKLLKPPQSSSNRGSSHPRQVATVKPLREFQLQEENKRTLPAMNVIMHSQDCMEGSQMAGLVPRVMESLSITKSSLHAKEEDPPIAGVLYPEAPSIYGKRPGIESFFYKGFFLPSGTHEASQPTEQQTSLPHEQAASSHPTSGTKAGSAGGKNKLTEADLAVLESMMVAQEAEMEEMAFKIEAEAAQAKIELEGSYLTNDAVSIEKGMEKQMIRDKSINTKIDVPVHSSVSISPSKPESLRSTHTDTGQHHGDPTKKTIDVPSVASIPESNVVVAEAPEASHVSSDEGEEQLMIMRDSPRWEDEEIQAEDNDEPRTIKAEIKLLVKTTEVGKESIEIRSIREFVENENADLIGSGGTVQSPAVDSSQLIHGDVHHLQSTSSHLPSPNPKFTRPQVVSSYSSYCEPTQDEFDLMAQVRDVVQPNSGAGAQDAPGLDVEEMSSGMEGYASDGNDPMTTTHITRYDPDPLPITTSTTTTTTTTTRVIRRTKEEDGEVKEEEEIFEEY